MEEWKNGWVEGTYTLPGSETDTVCVGTMERGEDEIRFLDEAAAAFVFWIYGRQSSFPSIRRSVSSALKEFSQQGLVLTGFFVGEHTEKDLIIGVHDIREIGDEAATRSSQTQENRTPIRCVGHAPEIPFLLQAIGQTGDGSCI
jgi:hypothetical protein